MTFARGITNGTVQDQSTYGHNVTVVGSPKSVAGGSPSVTTKKAPPAPPGSYMTVNGVNDYLVITHTPELALGKNNTNFTVSFALL